MNSTAKNIPDPVNRFLQDHFPNGHVDDVKDVVVDGVPRYRVHVETDEFLYQLEFDRQGHLLNKSSQKRFDTEYTYEDFFDD